jgi:hypothetical protein
VAAPAIQFKGSGWYVTDYARKSAAPASDATPGDAPAAGSSDSGGGAGAADSKSKSSKPSKKTAKEK